MLSSLNPTMVNKRKTTSKFCEIDWWTWRFFACKWIYNILEMNPSFPLFEQLFVRVTTLVAWRVFVEKSSLTLWEIFMFCLLPESKMRRWIPISCVRVIQIISLNSQKERKTADFPKCPTRPLKTTSTHIIFYLPPFQVSVLDAMKAWELTLRN